MRLLIGLGNPTKQYQSTRHNIGQMVINRLIANSDHASLPHDTIITNTDTYMNESGPTVQKLVHYYKVSPVDLYVVHDDLDIGVGEYKIQFGRSPAGHHGVESIVQHLGTQDFHRIRIGIGHPRDSANPNLPVEDYVLLPFSPTQRVIIDQTIDKVIVDIKNILGR